MLEFTVGRTRVRLSVLFFAMAALWLTLDRSGMAGWCVAASSLHELGHLTMLAVFGHAPAELCAGAFGLRLTQAPDTLLSYRQSIAVALAGPAVNLLLAGVTAACGDERVTAVHLVLGVFNLLPMASLDGGQALYHTLAARRSETHAHTVMRVLSVAVLLPLTAAGSWLLWANGNFTLLLVSLYLSLRLLRH